MRILGVKQGSICAPSISCFDFAHCLQLFQRHLHLHQIQAMEYFQVCQTHQVVAVVVASQELDGQTHQVVAVVVASQEVVCRTHQEVAVVEVPQAVSYGKQTTL